MKLCFASSPSTWNARIIRKRLEEINAGFLSHDNSGSLAYMIESFVSHLQRIEIDD